MVHDTSDQAEPVTPAAMYGQPAIPYRQDSTLNTIVWDSLMLTKITAKKYNSIDPASVPKCECCYMLLQH